MNDPRIYALVYGVGSALLTFLAAFSGQRLIDVGLEKAFWFSLSIAIAPYLVRQAEGFRDAQKPETITHARALDLLEETLAAWSRNRPIPPTAEDRTRIMDAVTERLTGPIDFDDDYHFANDGSGRHRGTSAGCTECTVIGGAV